jgi:predicted Zn-dependent peptidase
MSGSSRASNMYELTTLGNGLRILTVPISYVQSAAVGFFVGVGSRYECEALAGASHFVEHMLFKGTPRRPSALHIAEAIEGKGGIFNANTGLETTVFWAKVSAAHLPEALDVLSDMFLHAKFDPDDIEKERAVISEEISYALDAPDSLSQAIANQLQWPNHPLGREIAGTRQSIAALGRPELLAHMADHYRPSEIVLGMAGRVDHAGAVAWAQSNLGNWESGPPLTFEPAPPNHHGPNLHVEFKDTGQAHLCFSFEGLSRTDPDRFVLRLLNMILGEGMRSRLFQQVRERLGLAYCVDSFASTLHDTGTVGIYAGVAAERASETIHAILCELDRLRQEPVPEDELTKARDFVRGRLTLSLEDSLTMAAWYARQELLGPAVLDPEDVLARFEAIEVSDVQRVAQTLFHPERLNLAMVGAFIDDGDRFRKDVYF